MSAAPEGAGTHARQDHAAPGRTERRVPAGELGRRPAHVEARLDRAGPVRRAPKTSHTPTVEIKRSDGVSNAAQPALFDVAVGRDAPMKRARDDNLRREGSMRHDVPKQADDQRAAELIRVGEFRVRSERDGVVHTVGLVGELDLATAGDVERELERVEASDALSIVLDLSGLTFMDSTGVRLVVRASARSRADSNRLALLRGPKAVQRVFELCGRATLCPSPTDDLKSTGGRTPDIRARDRLRRLSV